MPQNYIGERFGDYKLVRSLGEGGFASVYLGEEVHEGTPAAVKLLKEQEVHNFINEVRNTFRLHHPNIVNILDFNIRTEDNTAFIIMEYAPNGSFRDKYPRGTRVPLNVVVPTVKQVAAALQFAHDQRVIHRDVKPENLLLNAQNMVLLSDFGIATASRTATVSNAEKGDIIGTYAYMAPEQLKGRPSRASDQYSLGIMVYEWLCGNLPFEAREYIQWHYLHANEPPPALREHISSLSPDVEQVVLRALAKKPEERFERVMTFALALEQAAMGRDVTAYMSLAISVVSPDAPVPPVSPANRTQYDETPMNTPAHVAPPPKSIDQLFQEGVRSQASGNIDEAFRIWRQLVKTPGIAERYNTTARNRIHELRPQIIPLRLEQARDASRQGHWLDEIQLWEDLLSLEPSNQELIPLLKSPLTLGKSPNNNTQGIRERLQIAKQNEQAAWMYEQAQVFMSNNDIPAATTQLSMLWHDAPYYGDPADLSKALGTPAHTNYEQAIATEQARIAAEQAHIEQERLKQQKREQERLTQERQEQERREQIRLERERLAWEKQEQERLDLEKQEQLKADTKRLEDKRLNRVMAMSAVVGGIAGLVAGVVEGGIIGDGSIGGFVGGVTGGRIIGGIIGIIIGLIVEFVAGIFMESAGSMIGEALVGSGAGFTFGLSVGAVLWLLLGGTIGLIAGIIVALIVALIVRSMIRSVK